MSERSEKIDELVKALVAAQAEMPHPPKDAINPHFKSRFASLPGVIDTVRPVLSRHGLALLQTLGTGERGPVIHSTLLHRSGQWLDLPALEMPAVKADPQAWGSAATYGRRYALLAACGVTGDEDDDANEAAKPAPAAKKPAPKSAPPAPPKDGVELLTRTVETEKSLVTLGRLSAGALLKAFNAEADDRKLDADQSKWTAEQVAAMHQWAKNWVN